jgi:hypothetical protein
MNGSCGEELPGAAARPTGLVPTRPVIRYVGSWRLVAAGRYDKSYVRAPSVVGLGSSELLHAHNLPTQQFTRRLIQYSSPLA